jgi:hypothetical protein
VTPVSGLSGAGGLLPGRLVLGSDMTNPALRISGTITEEADRPDHRETF